MVKGVPRVVIVGGGFGGLAAAKALRHVPVHVTLIDRTNHHLFQPLLYQVATSVLAPGQIASPIRGILRKQKNATVILGEVTGVNKDLRCVLVNSADREGVQIPYDYLVLATGVRHSYFGHNEFENGRRDKLWCWIIRNESYPERVRQRYLCRDSWDSVEGSIETRTLLR